MATNYVVCKDCGVPTENGHKYCSDCADIRIMMDIEDVEVELAARKLRDERFHEPNDTWLGKGLLDDDFEDPG